LPRLILESRKIAATVIHGLHGRRRSGSGENFWQFRRFVSGEEARRIDWRRSARDDNLYVREREWEAAHTIWLWPDRSPSMAFSSRLARESKLDRSLTIAFALAEILVEAGERVGLPGLMRPTGSRAVIDRMAEALIHDPTARTSLPHGFAPASLSEIVCSPTCGARSRTSARSSRSFPATVRRDTSSRSSIRRRKPSPILAASSSPSRKAPARSPPAAPRTGAPTTRQGSGATATKSAPRPARLGWSFTIHRTDRPGQ
jgi:uncharacterized protein (DUF58 family)